MKSLKILFILIIIGACNNSSDILYQSEEFTVFSDKVVQGKNIANIESATKIVSNYKSFASENFSRLISFKFSINEKDNENPSGFDHRIVITNEKESPIIKFGQKDSLVPQEPLEKLPANYQYTFRLDMSPVLDQFKEKGYFEAFDGTKIAREDFKAVYIAGGSEPLTWDFSNLEENNLELKDIDKDGIYEITVILNPYNPDDFEIKEWNLSKDLSAKPKYESDQKIVDALFNLSLEEALMNIEPDSTLRTGAKWSGVWTRDISYSILLAFAYHEPEIAKISLMKKVKRGRIIQDTGSGGAWPVSSDRTTWALAAWEIYKVTGDEEWLKTSYEIIRNTLEDDFKTIRSSITGMYKGESSFLDWREQTYPKWMSNKDIYESENLGTNAVHYQAHVILAEMAKLLNKPYQIYEERAEKIKNGINKYLWMDEMGYYGQYLYGRTSLTLSKRFETLGEALSILFNVADEEQAKSIIENAPLTSFGASCIYPQIPGIPPYHNNGIWPFVQSYWNLAAAKVGNEEVLNHGLASIYRAGALFLTNYENFVSENGDYVGTEINSHRMLWSMAGNLAMVHRVFMGMSFETGGVRFQPVIPSNYSGKKRLSNFIYRNSILDIEVEGYGNEIKSITLDGETLKGAFLPATIEGTHKIVIKMANNRMKSNKLNLVKNRFSLQNPETTLQGDKIVWDTINMALSYNIYKNGKFYESTNLNYFQIEGSQFSEYAVSAVDKYGFESFLSEPIIVAENEEIILQLENYLPKANLPYTNYMGTGFVETRKSINKIINLKIDIAEPGEYFLDCRYSNGSGPWNTDNNCGIRSLYSNDNYIGVLVFPQRGENEWSDWGWTNSLKISFKEGSNELKIVLEEWNNNMDGEINDAMIDYVRLVKI